MSVADGRTMHWFCFVWLYCFIWFTWYIYNIIICIYIYIYMFRWVSPCFPKAAIPSAKPGAFREATHGRRKMSELSEETAEELGSKVWISMKPDNEHWNFKVDIHWYSIYIFIENSMEIEWKYQWTFWDRTMIFKLWNKYIYIYISNEYERISMKFRILMMKSDP